MFSLLSAVSTSSKFQKKNSTLLEKEREIKELLLPEIEKHQEHLRKNKLPFLDQRMTDLMGQLQENASSYQRLIGKTTVDLSKTAAKSLLGTVGDTVVEVAADTSKKWIAGEAPTLEGVAFSTLDAVENTFRGQLIKVGTEYLGIAGLITLTTANLPLMVMATATAGATLVATKPELITMGYERVKQSTLGAISLTQGLGRAIGEQTGLQRSAAQKCEDYLNCLEELKKKKYTCLDLEREKRVIRFQIEENQLELQQQIQINNAPKSTFQGFVSTLVKSHAFCITHLAKFLRWIWPNFRREAEQQLSCCHKISQLQTSQAREEQKLIDTTQQIFSLREDILLDYQEALRIHEELCHSLKR